VYARKKPKGDGTSSPQARASLPAVLPDPWFACPGLECDPPELVPMIFVALSKEKRSDCRAGGSASTAALTMRAIDASNRRRIELFDLSTPFCHCARAASVEMDAVVNVFDIGKRQKMLPAVRRVILRKHDLARFDTVNDAHVLAIVAHDFHVLLDPVGLAGRNHACSRRILA
jgi:hypothetical protein